MSLLKIWKARNEILEGVTNSIFKQDHIEEIAEERKSICDMCPFLDTVGTKCAIPGTAPCCGECGCKLSLLRRSLSSSCPKGFWEALLTESEEDAVVNSIKK